MTTIFEVEHLYQPDGWFSPGYLSVGDNGMILSVSETPPENDESTIRIPGFGVPGLANLHSHAFQRALAGRCESVSANPGTEDNLWTWRRAMYDLVGRMKPDQYEAIAAFVYLEMVKSGMTAVGEFHYVHHAPGGER
ncbi:MAG: amidohydrolase family protein, partial [Rhodospirillales bacterium]|nr:amidohydrolase family protein [Rhodospirillales bacterium]